jgi:uncharacterized lipoprotein YmbA
MISILFLGGCSIRTKSYYLLDGAKEVNQQAVLKGSVGVETIVLPRYFSQSNVAIKSGENRVSFITQAHWVSNMNEQLTALLITYLKRYFKTTNVYLYPWDVSKHVTRKVSLKIEHFIYHDKRVILDASWEIAEKGGQKIAKFFHTEVASSEKTDDIVKHMDEAFSKLELAIAKSLS